MFQSTAQEPHVVYLCYERRLFCISHRRSCSTNIINQGRESSLDWCAGTATAKNSLNHFLKRFGLNGLYHCVTKWSRHAILVIHGPDRLASITDNTRNVSIHISGMDGACATTVQIFTSSSRQKKKKKKCTKNITAKDETAYLRIYK